ncbi:calcium-binding protein CML protein [Dioscorea alata]|uniref:Calcium-binding protein CML protein n=1 Tax=Dioscorea alata TaxID=55571 RepID=A0ACB7WFX8_DIOAL|nr:calcium-binding protein CML protein [Dioscorea alata]
MASSTSAPKSSKWFSNKALKLSLHKLRHPKSSNSSSSSTTPCTHLERRNSRRANEFREAFRRFDVDGDGKISSQELKSFLCWAGDEVSSEAAEAVMRDFDMDGDGLMDYEDFVRLVESERGSVAGDEDLRRAFEMFVAEKGAGCITADGLQRMLSRLGDVRSYEECAAMIRAYDLDGNGVLDFNEFHRMMN